MLTVFFFFQAEDGIRDLTVTGVQTCALPIYELLGRLQGVRRPPRRRGVHLVQRQARPHLGVRAGREGAVPARPAPRRSEERRVGKECRYRWSTYHYTNKGVSSHITMT